MVVPVSLIAQFIGMFVASKLLKLNIGLVGIIVLTIVPVLISQSIPGIAGFALAIVSIFILLKVLDGSASIGKVFAIGIISLVTQAAIFKFVVLPSMNHAMQNANTVEMRDGSVVIDGKTVTTDETGNMIIK
ncbi:hypothetical protein A3762_12420 [Oleiphilus sp. HI0125]|uniref:hypothetical protein n=2 Tax=Oleiphilus sp. HI0125 TaxID=1822266 RepID=UPI0007C2A0FD|nr:hypothetical protein [Oleiphilus sp. HI0125]KZZ63394.1 hypothetical protein A3762_12420 [Oleiphilus sp. HI0125]